MDAYGFVHFAATAQHDFLTKTFGARIERDFDYPIRAWCDTP